MKIHKFKTGIAEELGVTTKTALRRYKKGDIVKVYFHNGKVKGTNPKVRDNSQSAKVQTGYVYVPHMLAVITDRATKTGRGMQKSV